MDRVIKEEVMDAVEPLPNAAAAQEPPRPPAASFIDLSSSDDDDSDDDGVSGPLKKRRSDAGGFVLPLGFLDPLPPEDWRPRALPPLSLQPISVVPPPAPAPKSCRQFWKAGDFEGDAVVCSSARSVGIDHVRVHPKFLHSNATSHKWALGALAELLDNALDEVCNGATVVNIDVLENKKDMTKMLLVEDNGGGMDPDKMRQCMSLGYSVKSKSANTIGQYGNGFKTSTMRLGADVIVFSRCHGKGGNRSTQSMGMLSYTFLRNTGKVDIVVPMLDYEKRGENWNRLDRSSSVDWDKNLQTIVQWSPYSSEEDLLWQFGSLTDQGTRIVIYNLWEDDQGELELDFESDYDIQVRGVNRDEKKIKMADQFPNSRHFLTYRHSLRSYASILYLRLPPGFKMILRGKEIEHHNIVDDMMLKQEVTYKPQHTGDGNSRDPSMVAVVTIGFVKDAKDHIDVQGFNVYHKNRLIKPFWRVWNTAGSGGRGVIGVLEANFVEPAHDKQDFERTIVLARLETRLVQMQKNYWGKHSHMVGYRQQTRKKLSNNTLNEETTPQAVRRPSSGLSRNSTQFQRSTEKHLSPVESFRMKDGNCVNGHLTYARENGMGSAKKSREKPSYAANESNSESEYVNDDRTLHASINSRASTSSEGLNRAAAGSHSKEISVTCNGNEHNFQSTDIISLEQLTSENCYLKDRLKKMEERKKSLVQQLEVAEQQLEQVNKEQEALIDTFSEERSRRDQQEENLRKKLKDASVTIQELLGKLSSSKANIKT